MATKTTLSIALVALLGLGLAGCGATTAGTNSGGDGPAAPLNLTGEWEQSNKEPGGHVHAATIVSDTVSIYWVADGSKSLYWAGSVAVPEKAGTSFTWDSVNDKTKTASAMLASGAETKTFKYNDGTISYEASALGKTWTVELRRSSTTPAAAPEAPSSGLEVAIKGATFAKDYADKPVIVVTYEFTNNSDEAESFAFSLNAQAFQGDIELDDLVIGLDDIDSSLESADIRPGATVTVRKPYLLRDSSTVSVEVRELFGSSGSVMATQEFAVSK